MSKLDYTLESNKYGCINSVYSPFKEGMTAWYREPTLTCLQINATINLSLIKTKTNYKKPSYN